MAWRRVLQPEFFVTKPPPHDTKAAMLLADTLPADHDTGLHVAQLVRSAAHAAECPIAVFYQWGGREFETTASFGLDAPSAGASAERILTEATRLGHHGLLMVNDIAADPTGRRQRRDQARLSPVVRPELR